MEQKLANCGRCGLEVVETRFDGNPESEKQLMCPACGRDWRDWVDNWNATQFAHKTERVNAAAVAICTGQHPNDTFEGDVLDAEELIEMEDARARVRWAEMQKGE